MLAVLVGVAAALVYGSADFLGGLASQRISPLKVTAIGAVSGLVLLFVLLPVLGGTWSTSAVLLGALTGVTGSAAIMLLYACLAIGPMSILSPTTAVVSAIVPAIVGVFRGERLGALAYGALGIALVAVVLVGFVPERGAVRPSLRGLIMAVASGSLIGVFFIVIDLTPDDSGLIPLILNRAVNGTLTFTAVAVIALVMRRRVASTSTGSGFLSAGWRGGLWFAVACGVVDAGANALLLLGFRLGDLTVQSVLTALYPAGTILLAAIVLRERIAPVQLVGLVLALVAAALLAVA